MEICEEMFSFFYRKMLMSAFLFEANPEKCLASMMNKLNFTLASAAVFSLVTQRASLQTRGGALRNETKGAFL